MRGAGPQAHRIRHCMRSNKQMCRRRRTRPGARAHLWYVTLCAGVTCGAAASEAGAPNRSRLISHRQSRPGQQVAAPGPRAQRASKEKRQGSMARPQQVTRPATRSRKSRPRTCSNKKALSASGCSPPRMSPRSVGSRGSEGPSTSPAATSARWCGLACGWFFAVVLDFMCRYCDWCMMSAHSLQAMHCFQKGRPPAPQPRAHAGAAWPAGRRGGARAGGAQLGMRVRAGVRARLAALSIIVVCSLWFGVV